MTGVQTCALPISNGESLQGYVRTVGFDTDASVVTWLTGIITKGAMVGSSLGGSNWFAPVAKTKYNPLGYYGGSTFTGDTLLGPDATPITPGYGTAAGWALGAAGGCLDGTSPANLLIIAVGGGSLAPTDPLLQAPASGLRILL